MELSSADFERLADRAISAAIEAGEMIARSRPLEVEHKPGGTSPASQVVTEIDRRSEAIIVDVLGPTRERFDLGLLAEERDDDSSRMTADYFWCIDPLDGTLSFVEGTPGYAVSIALVDRRGMPWVGVVYDPVEATILHAIKGGGVFRDGCRLATQPQAGAGRVGGEVLSVFADRSFVAGDDHESRVAALDQIAHDMGMGVVLHTSSGAVMNACAVLAQPPACYFKFPKRAGGGSLWDFAATTCLFHEAGAVATNMAGGPLDLNRPDSTFMNHQGVLFATNETLAARIRDLD